MNVRHQFDPFAGPAAAPAPMPPVAPQTERQSAGRSRGSGRLRAALISGGVLAALWAGMHWNDPASWIIGAPTVLMGAAVPLILPPVAAPRLSLRGTLSFALFLGFGILRGAADVSRRSLRPRALRPGMILWRTALPPGGARRLLALSVTLMPGTLTARLEGDRLLIHGLETGPALAADLSVLEARVAAIYRSSARRVPA